MGTNRLKKTARIHCQVKRIIEYLILEFLIVPDARSKVLLCLFVCCAGWMVGITGPTSVDPEVVKVFALLFCSFQCRPPARTFESLVRFWRDVVGDGKEGISQGGEMLVHETWVFR